MCEVGGVPVVCVRVRVCVCVCIPEHTREQLDNLDCQFLDAINYFLDN